MARTGKGSSSGWREIKPGENPTRQCLTLTFNTHTYYKELARE